MEAVISGHKPFYNGVQPRPTVSQKKPILSLSIILMNKSSLANFWETRGVGMGTRGIQIMGYLSGSVEKRIILPSGYRMNLTTRGIVFTCIGHETTSGAP